MLLKKYIFLCLTPIIPLCYNVNIDKEIINMKDKITTYVVIDNFVSIYDLEEWIHNELIRIYEAPRKFKFRIKKNMNGILKVRITIYNK